MKNLKRYGLIAAAVLIAALGVWLTLRNHQTPPKIEPSDQIVTTTQPPVNPNPPVVGSAYVVSANGRNVNLRAAPTTASKVIKAFRVGTRLSIITRGHDWCFIQIGGYYGYMMTQFIYNGIGPASSTDLPNWPNDAS